MDHGLSLQDHLGRQAGNDRQTGTEPLAQAVAEVILMLAAVSADLADLIALGPLAGNLGAARGRNADGEVQKDLDVRSHVMFRDALAKAPVAGFVSEEAEEMEIFDSGAPLCVALDPIDGSGNIDVNMSVGTIFSVVPTPARLGAARESAETVLWPAGTSQLAAGFVVYGPQTTLVLTTGASVDIFTLDRRTRIFWLTRQNLVIPSEGPDEYAINTSNYRHWEEPVRTYVDECLAGKNGPHGRDFNMRWHGALVAECYRIMTRGGIFLYPADARPAYKEGRLRLVYEAFPMAFLMEVAGGSATNGRRRILDIAPKSLHQHVPLILGSSAKVERVERLHHRPGIWPQTASPLFAQRGLFQV